MKKPKSLKKPRLQSDERTCEQCKAKLKPPLYAHYCPYSNLGDDRLDNSDGWGSGRAANRNYDNGGNDR